jgi:hypothetical protein
MTAWIHKLFHPEGRTEDEVPRLPPFDLATRGVVAPEPPATILRRERVRVCVYPMKDRRCDGCGRPVCWLALEFLARRRWRPVLVLHEVKLPVLAALLDEVRSYLEAQSEESRARSAK